MDSKAVFTQESHKEAFMGLCINVLPLIGEIIDSAKKSGVDGMVGLTVDTNGYISFDVSLYTPQHREKLCVFLGLVSLLAP